MIGTVRTKRHKVRHAEEPPSVKAIFNERNLGRAVMDRKSIEQQLEESREAKRRHRKSGHCELPRTCGGCHFWSGSIAALAKALGLEASID